MKQRERLEQSWFASLLVEDVPPGASGASSEVSTLAYVDFLCHLHKEIRNLLV